MRPQSPAGSAATALADRFRMRSVRKPPARPSTATTSHTRAHAHTRPPTGRGVQTDLRRHPLLVCFQIGETDRWFPLFQLKVRIQAATTHQMPRKIATTCAAAASTSTGRRDWAHPCHFCTRTGLTPVTPALGLGSPLPPPYHAASTDRERPMPFGGSHRWRAAAWRRETNPTDVRHVSVPLRPVFA